MFTGSAPLAQGEEDEEFRRDPPRPAVVAPDEEEEGKPIENGTELRELFPKRDKMIPRPVSSNLDAEQQTNYNHPVYSEVK